MQSAHQVRFCTNRDGGYELSDFAYQQCMNPNCAATYEARLALARCSACGELLDVRYEWDKLPMVEELAEFERRWPDRRNPLNFSGVWRFRELLPFAREADIVTIGEGQTQLAPSERVARYVGLDPKRLFLQYEGLNLSGSFKDNGMTAAFTHARMAGARLAGCASTGNTSASLALYAANNPSMRAVVFVGSGKIAFGKLAQALDYGALTLQIKGDFDDAMKRIQDVASQSNLYLMNSVNPFRLEGQKAIMYRVLEGLEWRVPDWVIVPGGNLGNSSAFGKAFQELYDLRLIHRKPRLAIVNSTGANTLYHLYEIDGVRWNGGNINDAAIQGYYEHLDASGIRAKTVASAIEINRPVNLKKAFRALEYCDGVVRQVPDEEILDAKAAIGAGGLGCEPASAASVAGARLLVSEQLISKDETVVCVLTGNALKDPDATVNYHSLSDEKLAERYADYGVRTAHFRNMPVAVGNDLDIIMSTLERSIGANSSARFVKGA